MSGMPPDDHESYHLAGLAGLYALDALDGEELVRFEALLETNAELRDEVAGFRATAARLSEVSAARPSPALRDSVLAQVATTRQDPPVVRLEDRRADRTRRRLLLAAAAAALVLVAGFGGYLVADRTGGTSSELASVLARSDTKVVALRGATSTEAAGRVVISPATGKVIVVSDKMPVPASGRTLELWKLDATGAHQAGLFEPDGSGRVEAALQADLEGATGFAVTDEPDGGSATPTTDVLMTATIE